MESILTFMQFALVSAGTIVVLILPTFLLLFGGFYYETKSIQKILLANDFMVFDYERSPKQILLNTLKYFVSLFQPSNSTKINYFGEIQAKTLKNKSLLMVQEKSENYPFFQMVFVIRNPKEHFPSFKMNRNLLESIPNPKRIEERNINDYYSLSATNLNLLVDKLSSYKMKKHFRNIAKQSFLIEHDQKLQTITLKTNKFKTKPTSVISFLLDLEEELEDYKEPNFGTQAELEQKIITKVGLLQHNVKIYSSVSLVNVKELKIRCVICWGTINYSTETLVFECCTGYTHLDHGVDWLQHNKDECPKCGQEHPFTIQLPSISLK